MFLNRQDLGHPEFLYKVYKVCKFYKDKAFSQELADIQGLQSLFKILTP